MAMKENIKPAGLGIYQFTPHENEELTAADALPRENKSKT